MNVLAEVGAGSWPDWVAAVGTTLAFGVAAQSYRHSVLLRRESQARLVYAKINHIEYHPAGAVLEPLPNGARVGNGSFAVSLVPQPNGDLATVAVQPLFQATLKIHNGSTELIGPVKVQLVDTGLSKIFEESSILYSSVEPTSDFVVTFTIANPHYPGEPSVGVTLLFRDASGRWWRRHLTDPVEAVHDDPENTRYTPLEMAGFAANARAMGLEPSRAPAVPWTARWNRLKRKLRGKAPIP